MLRPLLFRQCLKSSIEFAPLTLPEVDRPRKAQEVWTTALQWWYSALPQIVGGAMSPSAGVFARVGNSENDILYKRFIFNYQQGQHDGTP